MHKKNKGNKKMGPITTILIVTGLVCIVSLIGSIFNLQAAKTVINAGALETTVITVKNFFSAEGIKYLFSNVLLNVQMLKPLVLLIISLIGFGIIDTSGILQNYATPFKKMKSERFTFLVVLIGFLSTIIGEYSFVLYLPLVGLLYKYTGRNTTLGFITAFLGITLGYASGIIGNYDQYLLGTITQSAAAIEIDPNYTYNMFSTIFIMIASMFIMVPIISKLINSLIAPKFQKPLLEESDMAVSKKGLLYSNIAFIIMLLLVIYMIIPNLWGSGLLLDNSQGTYIAKLFSDASPFKEGIMLIILGMMVICGYIYGKFSKNIETSTGFSESLAKSLEKSGYIFLLLFFASQMIAILEWTNLGEVVVCSLVEMLSKMQISGILLISLFFILVILMTILMPSLLSKWPLVAPLIVPLFMRSNITPELTQFIFQVADGVGKAISIIFPYFIIFIGFSYYNNSEEKYENSIASMFKMISPTVLITALFWIMLIIIWYLAGFPLGISGHSVL